VSEQQVVTQAPEQPLTGAPEVEEEPAGPGVVRRLLNWLFSPWMKVQEYTSDNWQVDAHAAFIEQQPLRARALLYGIAILVVLLVVWSSVAKIDEVTRGQGKVIPSRQIQIVQSQDGGVVTEILVQEGDEVQAGQLLVRLDQTRSQSTFRENRAEYQALAVKAARLRAVVDETEFVPAQEFITAVPRIVVQELALYVSNRAELLNQQQIAQQQLVQREQELVEVTARMRQLAESLSLVQREMSVTRPMIASGAVSEVELLRLEREVNQLSGEHQQSLAQIARIDSSIQEGKRKLQSVELEFIGEVREELTDTITRINSLQESGTGLSDKVSQTAVRSPVRGTVKQLFYNTIGGVVLPGKEIIEVVPLDDTLLLEVRIRPQDIAFLMPGQKAMIKFTAYDFVVYGGMEGEVEHIGADTVMDEDGKPYYNVRVRTHEPKFDEDKPIIPGMTAEADILTGKKSILAYLMKPVLRAKQYALTER
jgi:adhesin transport system membrane fusion protein